MLKSTFNGTHQKYYQGAVILRMFNGDTKAMREWHDEYLTNLKHSQSLTPPTDEQLRMAKYYADGKLVREVAQKFGVTQGKAQAAINRVGRWKLLGNDV